MTIRSPHTILITGASGAIGSALARTYATSGVRLILHGRNTDRLQEVRQACERLGAVADCFTLDVRCIEPFCTWVREVDRATPLNLVIANAGVNIDIGADGRGEHWEAAEALLDTNIRATMALVSAVMLGVRGLISGLMALM